MVSAYGVKMIANINGKLVEIPMKRTGAASHGGVFIAHELGRANVKAIMAAFVGSPFRAIVDYPYDPSRISVNGLRSNSISEVRVGTPVTFDIDASLTHDAPITVSVPPVYQQPLLEKDKISPRLHHVRFTPVGEPGSIVPVEIHYDGKPIPFSPFRVKLLPETEVNKVKVRGLDGSGKCTIQFSISFM
ncbi:Filamin/ABP280 repeat protein [Ancylostoma duodenale]|uniref:Filamin/ABP280 repeat protein n=1 Tax=Ancylostoma duodenale TaxID=51022 RepID=A0A0C2H2B4_9BILA|nr:Filamin/ABP280 repeat protein [Ancylostoma duodenale]